MKKRPDRYAEIEITAFSKKGNGIGYLKRENLPDLKLEVPFSMPGDKTRVLIGSKKNDAYLCKLEEIIQKAEKRIEPKCLHFGVCGGCRLQELGYETQAETKQEAALNYFKSLVNQDVTIYPLIKADSPWNYRNKMEFTFSSDNKGVKYLGLMMEGGRGKVLNLTECHLTSPWFIETLKAVRSWWQDSRLEAYYPPKNRGSLRTLTLRESRATGDKLVMLTVSGNPEFALHRDEINSFKEIVEKIVCPESENASLAVFIRIQQTAKGMETIFYEMHLSGKDHVEEILNIEIGGEKKQIAFDISPTAFFQPNSSQAEKLYSKALDLANISKEDVVYDLYCGTGTLGIIAAMHAKTVVGIEISKESSLDARTNAKKNQLENITIHTGDVSKILKEKELPKPDIILVDPPRAGLEPKALEEIVGLDAKKIVYISCNPETQAENAKKLIEAGYQLKALCPVDQFPQTAHIENIALFTKE
ncbi:MAG TPA: 23S rRNA (uracil(1939)-C(5))-methyltransferase RlmD [Parachlamydiaceae bacterium]|nr:23S rRNA (uracil(1939)-C(5))-methyltransferase RlmD [Parachlamydiaceae bacterium]